MPMILWINQHNSFTRMFEHLHAEKFIATPTTDADGFHDFDLHIIFVDALICRFASVINWHLWLEVLCLPNGLLVSIAKLFIRLNGFCLSQYFLYHTNKSTGTDTDTQFIFNQSTNQVFALFGFIQCNQLSGIACLNTSY